MNIIDYYQLEIDSMGLFIEIITMTALVITLWAYLRQLRIMQNQIDEARKSTASQNMLALINFLQDEEVRKARTYVLKELKEKDYNMWDDDDKEHASRVASSYGSAGVILQSGAVPIEPIITSWGYSIDSTFKILKPFIYDVRAFAGEGYWSTYDWLYEEAIAKI